MEAREILAPPRGPPETGPPGLPPLRVRLAAEKAAAAAAGGGAAGGAAGGAFECAAASWRGFMTDGEGAAPVEAEVAEEERQPKPTGKVQGRFREGSGKVQGQPKPTGKVVVDGETWLLGGHAWLGKRGRRFWGDVGDKPSDGVLSRWLPAEGDDFALWRMDHEDGDGEDLEAYEVWHAMEAEITMDIVSRRVLLRTAGTFRRCAPRCTRWRPTCRCKIAVDF